jgi:uncharacterized protein YjbI with pentapeptide repeats
MTPEQNLTNRSRAIEFLKSSVADRSSQLEAVGLLRYAKLLTQMGVSDGNIDCVERFFTHPSRVKFPQLMGTDLQGLDLRGVNFIRANLTKANLAGCCLQDADLIFGNFSRANLTGANLRGATLNETIWTGANVYECDFREAIGLTANQVRDLRSAGGIFEKS